MTLFKRKTRAERNEANYRKWLRGYQPTTTKQKINLLRIWTDRSDNNYYIPANVGNITRERAIMVEKCMTAIMYGVNPDDIRNFLVDMEKRLEKMPWQMPTSQKMQKFQKDALSSVKDLIYRMNNIEPEELMIEAALYLTFMDGENPYLIEKEIQDKKRERVKNDEELRAFFLTYLEAVLKSSNDSAKETSLA